MNKTLLPALSLSLCAALSASVQTAAQTAKPRAVVPALPAPPVGQSAPDFTLKDTAGRKHSLKDYRGKPVVVGFIAARCNVSNAYAERLRSLAADYKAKGVVFLAVNSAANEPVAEIKDHAAQNKFDFTILKDDGNKVADLYGAVRTPEMYVVDAAGVLRYHGRVDSSIEPRQVKRHDLRETLDEVLAGKSVTTPETKAFGCLIVRAKQPAAASATFAGKPQTAPAEAKIALLKPAEFLKLKEQTKGQVLVVNFWATWCGPCVAEFPEFVKLDAEYAAKGVKIIAISADEVSDLQSKVIPFVRTQKALFDVYVQNVEDPQEMIDVVTKDWEGALPATFVYDRQGRLSYSRFGIIDREELVKAMESAMK
jgi:peroxiredoxin